MVLFVAHAATRQELVPKMPQPYPILVEALARIAASNDSIQISEIAREAARNILSAEAIALIRAQGLEMVAPQSAPLLVLSANPHPVDSNDVVRPLAAIDGGSRPPGCGRSGAFGNVYELSRTVQAGAEGINTAKTAYLSNAIGEIDAALTLARAASAAISRCAVFAEMASASVRLELERDEVRHRLKNVYASAIGLANLSLPKEHSTDFAARLRTLAEVHRFLDDEGGMTPGFPLHELLAAVLSPYQDPGSPRIIVEGPEIEVAASFAAALGLIANELATNALKHGALSVGSGQIIVQWTCCDGEIGLWWREVGGPKKDGSTEANEGSKLMRLLVERQLRGKMVHNVTGSGLHFAVLFPIE
jgi:two-component sensor histidine kinase